MKIIYSHNIPTDLSNEHLWLDDVPENVAQRICDKLNEPLKRYENGMFYRVVSDNHKLYKWEP
jgi:hypothetical protein